jgi:glycosyltransferase involved in cell wall biosynthesis
MKNVWVFHLLNDFSGSPLVLKNSILSLKAKANVTVCTSDTKGFLSGISDVNYSNIEYKWNSNKLITLFNFFKVQWALFWLIIFNRKQIDILYINTLLPFAAALAGKICRKKIIYHLHEPQISPRVLFAFLISLCRLTATRVIFVSEFMKNRFPMLRDRGVVIHNVLNKDFVDSIVEQVSENRNTVLMLCSFKTYKGVYDFVELAILNPQMNFELVLNSDLESIQPIVRFSETIENITIYPATENVHQFYQRAKVVVNLSHPNQWIESFGMTILEAMAYRLPCIVPEVGGVTELVSSKNGYCISFDDKKRISEVLAELFKEAEHYKNLAKEANRRSKDFDFEHYSKGIQKVIL